MTGNTSFLITESVSYGLQVTRDWLLMEMSDTNLDDSVYADITDAADLPDSCRPQVSKRHSMQTVSTTVAGSSADLWMMLLFVTDCGRGGKEHPQIHCIWSCRLHFTMSWGSPRRRSAAWRETAPSCSTWRCPPSSPS